MTTRSKTKHHVVKLRGPVRSLALALLTAFLVKTPIQAQDVPAAPAPETILIPQPDTLPLTEVAVDDAAAMDEEDGETLLRGPVHEAYAEQVNENPVPGMIVAATPPEAIEELPPDIQPDGRTVEWISGYWAWDEDQDDFMWVSGIWREVPQGFRWLPGYWAEAEGGFQWVSGTWVPTQTAEIEYIETAPPETLEVGPVGVAPTPEHIWISGCWSWQENRYAWRPGYYSTGYANWIWVPARHHWTPRGYYQCTGYWDYSLERRGVLFAPRRFNRLVRNQRGFRFTPRIVVASNRLTAHLWVRPRYQHYYFGDYYGTPYANRGLQPWHQFHRQHRGADPLFTHYSRGRDRNAFYNLQNTQFNLLVNEPDRRPLHNLREQNQWFAKHNDHGDHNDRQRSLLGTQLQKFVESSDRQENGLRFVKLQNEQKQRVQNEAEQIRNLARDRRRVEALVKKNDVVEKNADDLNALRVRNEKLNDRDGDREKGGRDPKGDGPKNDSPKSDGQIADALKADGPKNDAPKSDAPKNDGPKDRGSERLANERPDRAERLKLPAVVRPTTAAVKQDERRDGRQSNREEKEVRTRDAKISDAATSPGKVMSEIDNVRRARDNGAAGLADSPDKAAPREDRPRDMAKENVREKGEARPNDKPAADLTDRADRKVGDNKNPVETIVRDRLKQAGNDVQAPREKDRERPPRSNGSVVAEPADKRVRDNTPKDNVPRSIAPDNGNRVRDTADRIRSDIQNRAKAEKPAASEPPRRENVAPRRVESAPVKREPPVRRADPAPPRNDPPPRRSDAAPRKADPAPREKAPSGGPRNEGGRRKK